jgi:predicted HicB family RNase H-like nuclease
VPFAVKLPQELVKALQEQAVKKSVGLNELTAELLKKSLAK